MSKRRGRQAHRSREIAAVIISILVIISMGIFYVLPPPNPPEPAFPTFDLSQMTPLATNTPVPTPTAEPTSVVPPAPRPPTPTATPTPSP